MIGRVVEAPNHRVLVFLGVLLAAACGAPVPDSVGIVAGGLQPCVRSSNCVRSGDGSDGLSLRLIPGTDLTAAWAEVVDAVSTMPRTRVISRTDRYIHAEVTSRLFRFRDDLELLLEQDGEVVQLRSASRIGRSDMGVNQERVDRLIELLVSRGLVRPPG
ncbi:MAG: DUF1499 domain-containing protein [Longimicrobiales bacterium]